MFSCCPKFTQMWNIFNQHVTHQNSKFCGENPSKCYVCLDSLRLHVETKCGVTMLTTTRSDCTVSSCQYKLYCEPQSCIPQPVLTQLTVLLQHVLYTTVVVHIPHQLNFAVRATHSFQIHSYQRSHSRALQFRITHLNNVSGA